MSDIAERYDRNIRLFGKEGQLKLQSTTATVVGVGGLGSPLVQHLALLGVGNVNLFDDDELDETSRNRFIGAREDDLVPGSAKVKLSARLVGETNSGVEVRPEKLGLVSEACFDAVKGSDWVFGCFDEDGPRSILNELCAAYEKPYVDLASDVADAQAFGGRVLTSSGGHGCLSCLGVLDSKDVRRFFATEEEAQHEDKVYGITRSALGEKGPSVSPLNGVIASLAATEFMVGVTGMRAPTRYLEYRGHEAKVLVIKDKPRDDCMVCRGIFGRGANADIERYLALPALRGRRR